jgi:CubicO group peptidase (beta-lactamase class C family)
MQNRITTLFLLLISISLFAQVNNPPPDFEQFIDKVRETFEVPGLCVAIVKDGEVVLASGFGTKDITKNDPVDEKTLFGIASNTKAFTATALGILVEEGKIKWDGRVIDYLPWFQMSDPYVTREMTILDLLVHRSGLGLGAGDLLWWPTSTYDRKEIVRRLRYVPLKTSFRSAYAYDNVLYTVAGEVIEAVSGKPWEEFVQTRILDPVGMTTSDVRHSAGIHGGNIAVPHAKVEGVVRAVAPFTSDNVNPAGGIHSNAMDMAKWMIVQLDSGKLSGEKRLYSTKTASALWSPVTPKPIPQYSKELAPMQMNFHNYALGFNVQDYRGIKLVTHTGGLPGYVSRLAMIPEIKLGVTVLTNQESGAAINAVAFQVLDYYLNAQSHDWIAAYKIFYERRAKREKSVEQNANQSRAAESKPSLKLSNYAGTYRDVWYGDINIEYKNEKLEIVFAHTPDLKGEMVHWQYDTFVVRWYDRSLRGDAFITFSLDLNGKIEQAKMKPFSPAVDFSFDYQDLLLVPLGK